MFRKDVVWALCLSLTVSAGCGAEGAEPGFEGAFEQDDDGDSGLVQKHRKGHRGKDGKRGRKNQKYVRKLRQQLERHDVQPIVEAPEVSDELFDLGEALAFDKLLSGNRNISCMTCHHPNLGSDDDRSLPLGEGGVGLGQTRSGGHVIPRSAPPLFNLHAYDTMFWDNRVFVDEEGDLVTPAGEQLTDEMREVLEFGVVAAQAMFPVTSREEMRGQRGDNELADLEDNDFQGIWAALMTRLRETEGDAYRNLFEAAYPGTYFEDMSFAHAANAIAGWEISTFRSEGSPFQRFVAGDDHALDKKQLKGAIEFYKTGCGNCHSGGTLSDFAPHNTLMAQFGPGKGDGESGRDDFGFERVSGDPADRYKFRTPPLFNVALTAPYGHVGQHDTLKRHIEHYDKPNKALRKYRITRAVENEELHDTFLNNRRAVVSAGVDRAVDDLRKVKERYLLRFLHSLTDPGAVDLSHTVPDTVPSGLPVED